MNFTKMHGTGNDFIVVEGGPADADRTNWPEVAREACSRRFGVGADGILVIRPSDDAALRMQIFNPDGSEAEMCGNGNPLRGQVCRGARAGEGLGRRGPTY